MANQMATMDDKRVGVTVSQLRDFTRSAMQDYGVCALDRDESASWKKEFSASSFAFHFRLSGRQAGQALDALAAADLVSWVETRRGYDERWALTRNGLYVTEALVKNHNRVQATAARAIQSRMASLRELGSDFTEVRQVIGWGPWMSRLEYGPVLIGLDVASWASLEPARRLRLIAAVVQKLALHEALPARQVPSVAVLGFEAGSGVPWRLRTHQLLGGSGVEPHKLGEMVKKLKRSQLDVDESAYGKHVQDLAVQIGMWSGEGDQYGPRVDNLYWWEVSSARFEETKRDLAQGANAALMAIGRGQVAAELAAVRLAPCEGRKAKGRAAPSEQLLPDDQENEDDSQTRWGVPTWARVEGIGLGGVRLDAIGAHAEAMHERGVLEQASVEHARSMGSKAKAGEIREVYREGLKLWLKGLQQQERINKVAKKPQQKAEVQYITVFTVGLGEPKAIAIVRQPLTQRKAFWSALDAVKTTVLSRSVRKYGEQMMAFLMPEGRRIENHAFDGMGLLTCAYRPSRPEERDVIDSVAREVGRVVRSIHVDHEGRCIASMRGFFDTEEIKGSHGIDRLEAEPTLPLMIDGYEEAKQLLDEVRKTVGPAFFADFDERWLDPATTGLHRAMLMMSGAEGELMGQRLLGAVWSDVWFDNQVWPPATAAPSVTRTPQGDVKIVASFPDGSASWEVGANLKVVQSDSETFEGRKGWYRADWNTWEVGVLELVHRQEVVRTPLFVRIDQKKETPSLGDALGLLRSMRWLCTEDPVGLSKALVPGHWSRTETFGRLWDEAVDARRRARDAGVEDDRGREDDDRYEVSRQQIASHITLTDVQWMAALIDLALDDYHSSAVWSRNVLSAALGPGSKKAS